jgi:hypothetical protein
MVDGKETVTVKRRQVMGEERKGKDEVEECDWWGLYSVSGKDGSWTGNCVAGLLGESTCMCDYYVDKSHVWSLYFNISSNQLIYSLFLSV